VAGATATVSAWAPLRHRLFRALYVAQFASNAGTWMQVVGAQWLMGDLGGGPFAVALVQTATSLPIFLLVLPAGALGDVFDRRRVLLAAQGAMLVATGLLAALTAADLVTPALLLALVFLVGAGQALSVPCWQATVPELVERPEIPQAAALNGVNFNLARAVGPAIGGLIIAVAGPEAVFALNSVSFLGTLAVLSAWRRPPRHRALVAEHVWEAVSAGGRFVRSAPTLRIVLVRSALFMAFASALWALLPVVARGPLGLGAGGYGLLLGSVGVGAVAGAFVLPVLRARLPLNTLVALAGVAYAGALAVIGLPERLPFVVGALVVAGLAWIAVLSSLNASAQTLLPDWARARGLAYYTLTFQGAQALGALVWGALAGVAGLAAALVVAAAGLVAGALAGRRLRLVALDLDLRPARHWPEPHLVLDPEPEEGPVLVTVEWRVPAEHVEAFREAMAPVGRSRRRTGARRWGLFQDAADPERFLEVWVVGSWEEHLRQHDERTTVRDEELEARARALARAGELEVRHLLSAYR
jgi:MFS family permease